MKNPLANINQPNLTNPIGRKKEKKENGNEPYLKFRRRMRVNFFRK